MSDTGHLQETQPLLSQFLRSHQDEIIRVWKERMRTIPQAQELSDSAIVDHLPRILRLAADYMDAIDSGRAVSFGDLPDAHALDRLGLGFDIHQVVDEYALLRRTILDVWESSIGFPINPQEIRSLGTTLDNMLSRAARRFADAREALLKALDRVSEAALASADVESFLQRLVRAMLEGAGSIDTCVILLREADTFRVRAAVGLDQELGRRYPSTEGFAGHVATEGRPISLRDASTDPMVVSPVLKGRVHALYGVPMMREGKVIGVAHMGSLTAFEFSEEEKLLFRTMVSRATSGVVKAQILADLERTEAAQRFLAEASKQFAASLDYEQTLAKIAHLAVPTIADWCVVDLWDGQAIRRVSVAHVDPQKVQLAHELERRYPTDPEATSGAPKVLRTGVPEWRTEIGDADLVAGARDPDHLTLLRELGPRSYIVVPITSHERVLGTIALITAESGRRYSEADVHVAEDLASRAAVAIENARLYREAQRAIVAREKVLAVVSHDLRNQLGVVAMAAELAGRKASAAPDVAKPVDTIRRTADSMQHLVADLLDMGAIQAGRLAVDVRRIALRPILEQACEMYRPSAVAKGLELRLEHSPDVDVLGDANRILQVVGNVVGNAIKFTDSGPITIDAAVSEGDATVAIRDSGHGIAAEDMTRIFDPYQTSNADGNVGTGLGLFIAKGIIERHGGRIWVDSIVGQGSTFFFTLPRARQS
jgi:signal transduction histidine kinase